MNLLRIQADSGNAAAVVEIASTDRNVVHRAAAIAAIGESKDGPVHEAIVPNCLNFPKKDSDQAILIGAMSGALWEKRDQVNNANYREGLKAYIGLLAPAVGLSHTLQVQIARHLQWIIGGPALHKAPEPWLEILSRGDIQNSRGGGGHTVAGPRFFGIETEGERFVYVVDMSDSMCKLIDPSSKPGGPITGPKPKKKKGILDESDLPWHQITTRWDLAREQLRVSLSRLPSDKYFSVVWFGTDAGTLDSCKGMIRATPANIDRVMKELDAIKTGPADPVRSPDGVLRGNTNLHEGLRRAYALHEKGYAETGAYVDPGALTDGCDTIFLLSDGAPSCDGFGIEDKDYGEGNVVVDREYGAGAQRTPRLNYPGPYVADDWLLADLKRMNAFRRIRMHCIGLGEANAGLLKKLAEVGHGESFFFGQKKQK